MINMEPECHNFGVWVVDEKCCQCPMLEYEVIDSNNELQCHNLAICLTAIGLRKEKNDER